MKSAIRLGVFDYLLKPIDDEELEETLASLVRKLQEEDHEYEELKKKERSQSELIPLPKQVSNHVINATIAYIADTFSEPVGSRKRLPSLIFQKAISVVFSRRSPD